MKAKCLFQLSYLYKEEKLLGKKNIAAHRIKMGELLGKRSPVKADYVIPIPETSIFNALGYSYETKIPFMNAIFKKRPKTKTLFIDSRVKKIEEVFIYIPSLFRNKKIVLVDETIISGLSLKVVLQEIRKFKPKEIHVRVACKPMDKPCPKNSFSDNFNFLKQDYKKYFKIDSIGWLEDKDLSRFASCYYCFGGKKNNSVIIK